MPSSKKGGKNSSLNSKANNTSATNTGANTPAVQVEPSTLVLGVNFGASYSSVAVINNEGHADVIADEDGARQIANAVSFAGQEEYIGIPGRKQLVRNNQNTVLRFRDLLGQSYSEASSFKAPFSAAQVVDKDGEPAFKLTVSGNEEILTVSQVTAKFLGTLYKSAADFLGRRVDAAIFTVPHHFTDKEKNAIRKASEACGVKVEQFIPEVAAAAISYGLTTPASDTYSVGDRNILFLDVGASSTTASVVASRLGLLSILSSVRDPMLGGDQIDEKLVDHFAKEFTKKTKAKFDMNDHRALTKLRLEVEQTKRTLSASTSATIAIESLSDGLDFSGNVNRTRLDLLCSSIYGAIVNRAEEAVKQAGLDPVQIHEVVLIGGTTKLPSLVSRIQDLFAATTVVTSQIEPDEVLAKGCALQAHLLLNTPFSGPVPTDSFTQLSRSVPSTTKPIGLLLGDDPSTSKFIPLLDQHAPLPARKTMNMRVPGGQEKEISVLLSIWEGEHDILVEQPAAKSQANGKANGSTDDADDEDDDEDDEEEPKKTPILKASTKLADLVCKVDGTLQGKGRAAAPALLAVTITIEADGSALLEAKQSTAGAETYSIRF